jgi:hypothetical protein
MNLQDITKEIQTNGKLNNGVQLLKTRDSITKVIRKSVPTKGFISVKSKGATSTSTSHIISAPGDPDGFGAGFIWDRSDDEILLALFINPADYIGVYIDGIHPGDWVEVTSAAGIASFSTDKGHPLASSLIALVAAGGDAIATYYGHPELVKPIGDVETFIQGELKGTGAGTKHRDAFGVEPGTGLKARGEGGVIVCLPDAGGPCYSGDSDHQNRWIKNPGDRIAKNYPPNASGAFFLVKGGVNNKGQANIAGQVYVLAWDWNFGDNAGYYEVFLHIKKGNLPNNN